MPAKSKKQQMAAGAALAANVANTPEQRSKGMRDGFDPGSAPVSGVDFGVSPK
jgi:hypothetical protein